ncbi:MAG TPA: flagellar motor switch protein FliG [Rhodanobacteraceae bacterium]|nr:flagellar motor switch protein FliG [Rhodanobacteraceae bacterium]
MAEPQKLTGAQRASVLLLSLGEQDAAAVLKHMDAREVQAIGTAMATLKNVSRDDADSVLDAFAGSLGKQTSFGVGTEDYVRKMLTAALGEEKAGGLLDRILVNRGSKSIEALKWMDGATIAELVGGEHPQIIAIVLAHLDPPHASEVLANLPVAMRSEVVMRIATLDGVQPSALLELDQIMERQVAGAGVRGKAASLGGVKAAAQILNSLDSTKELEVMESIVNADADLGQRIQEQMFVFDDLLRIDDRGLQTLLRDVPSDRLVIALKGADPTIREKIFSNMSKRAADMMREDLEVKGPVRLSEVDAAQKEILAAARALAEQGQINLGGGSDEYV